MHLLAVPLLFLFAASAQELPREYLVRLGGAETPASLRAKGITPLHHKGEVWVVRTFDEKALRQITKEISPAITVTIEFQSGAENIERAITDAGGILTRTYRSVPAMSAVIPSSRLADIQKLPGIKRIRKNREYRALSVAYE
jgi:hypothetical protein